MSVLLAKLEKDELKKVEHYLNEASVNAKIYLNNLRFYEFLNKLSCSMENKLLAKNGRDYPQRL